MCSLSWQQFPDHLGVAFTRDESVVRPKAELPKHYDDAGVRFIMPRDPQGDGSWLAVNEYGIAIFLLNDYQGQLKLNSEQLVSRGLLVRRLASATSIKACQDIVKAINVERSQPFHLMVFSQSGQHRWHYNGRTSNVLQKAPTKALFSSGHPEGQAIIDKRTELFAGLNISRQDDLLSFHRKHLPLPKGDLAYSVCMHRVEAKSQSLTYVALTDSHVSLRYWDGQPCETDDSTELKLELVSYK